jgi:hypothetical protein
MILNIPFAAIPENSAINAITIDWTMDEDNYVKSPFNVKFMNPSITIAFFVTLTFYTASTN